MEAEQARTRSEAEHRKTAAYYNSCISHMRQLEKKLKRSINKSRFGLPFSFLRAEAHAHGLPFVARFRTSGTTVPGLGSADWVQMFGALLAQSMQCSEPRNVSAGGGVLFLQRFSTSLTTLSLAPCRPYFELKAKYYLQLEVRQIQVNRGADVCMSRLVRSCRAT